MPLLAPLPPSILFSALSPGFNTAVIKTIYMFAPQWRQRERAVLPVRGDRGDSGRNVGAAPALKLRPVRRENADDPRPLPLPIWPGSRSSVPHPKSSSPPPSLRLPPFSSLASPAFLLEDEAPARSRSSL